MPCLPAWGKGYASLIDSCSSSSRDEWERIQVAEGGRYFNENKSGNVQATVMRYSHFQKTFFTIWGVSTAASVPVKMRTLAYFYKYVVNTCNMLGLVFRQVRDDVCVCVCVCVCGWLRMLHTVKLSDSCTSVLWVENGWTRRLKKKI